MSDNFNSYSDYKKSRAQANEKSREKVLEKRVRTKKRNSKQPEPARKDKPKKKIDKELNKKERKLEKARLREERAKLRKEKMTSLTNSALLLGKLLGKLLLLGIIIGEIILMINLNAKIDMIQFEINDLDKELDRKKEIVKALNTEKEAAYKSETIENLARYKLGMVYPTKEQTIYINLD